MPDPIIIRNNDGMEALVAQIAADKWNQDLHFLSMVGSLTAVKAIWASLQAGRKLSVAGSLHLVLSPHKKDKWVTIKGTLYNGRMRHWLIVKVPTLAMDYPVLPIWKFNGNGPEFITDPEQWEEADKHQILVEYLRLYTLWPVLPEWGEALWEAGCGNHDCWDGGKLIHPLTYRGMPWAFRVSSLGWDGVIDSLVKQGAISIG
jgi:hypothetical protein